MPCYPQRAVSFDPTSYSLPLRFHGPSRQIPDDWRYRSVRFPKIQLRQTEQMAGGLHHTLLVRERVCSSSSTDAPGPWPEHTHPIEGESEGRHRSVIIWITDENIIHTSIACPAPAPWYGIMAWAYMSRGFNALSCRWSAERRTASPNNATRPYTNVRSGTVVWTAHRLAFRTHWKPSQYHEIVVRNEEKSATCRRCKSSGSQPTKSSISVSQGSSWTQAWSIFVFALWYCARKAAMFISLPWAIG